MPAFQYAPFDASAYVTSIGSLLAHQGDPAAQAAVNIANANARAKAASGDIWGRTIQQVGQLPAQVMAQRQDSADRAQERQLRQLQITQGQNAIDQKKNGERVSAAIMQNAKVGPNGDLVYDIPGFVQMVQADPTLAPFAHEPADAMQKANDAHQQWMQGQTKNKEGALQTIYANTAAAGGSPDDFQVIALPFVKGGVVKEDDLAPMFKRLRDVPDPAARLLLLRGAGGVKPEYKEVGPGGTLNEVYPGAPPTPIASSPAKRTEAESALDAYAKSIGKAKAEDLTDADRQTFVKRDAQAKAEQAFQQHVREHAYDVAHPAPVKGKSQDELEQEARGVLQREFSSRSGGLGLEDQKVNQAIHLTTLLDQYEGKPMPAQIQAELALGLARLTSPSGSVGVQLEQEFNQRTAEGDVSKAVAWLTGDPTLVNASPEKLRAMFRDSIVRQGHVAEDNRQTYLNAMVSMLPTQLEESRKAALSKGVVLNRVDTVKMQAPNGQVKDVPRNQIEHFKSLGAKVIGG